MENKRTSKVAYVEIEGTKYALSYDFNAIAQVENETGGNLLNGLMDLAHMSAVQFRGLLCAAIRAADKKSKITVEQVSALLKYGTISQFSEALAQSILISLPKKAKEPVAEQPAEDPPADTDDQECL